MQGVGRFATMLVLVLSLGLHWSLLQTVAWTSMIIRYSHASSFADALRKTFDGRHPCSLCRAVQQGRKAEKEQEQHQTKPGSKLDPGIVWQPVSFAFACESEPISSPDTHALSRLEAPLKPPPRAARRDGLA